MSVVLGDDNESAFSESSGLSLLSGCTDGQSLIGNGSKIASKRGRRKKAEPKPKVEPPFVYNSHLKESNQKPIYGVAINPYIKNAPFYFATAAGNRCTIYKCPLEGPFELMHCYCDKNNDESYYCCVWSYDALAKQHLLAFAGQNGIIRIISPSTGDQVCELVGHGSSINELTTHPTDPNLLLSASKDHTLRLWNLRSKVCIAVLGGSNGHRDEVLSADFDVSGEKIVSSGIDHTIRIWQLIRNPDLDLAIKRSYRHEFTRGCEYKTIKVDHADFVTKDIHTNYVDCVRFFGDLIVSKACENSICIWKPGDLNMLEFSTDETNVAKIRDYKLPNCFYWFMKFAIDSQFKWLAAGNHNGYIYIWNLRSNVLSNNAKILKNSKCTSNVRQLAFTPDGKVLIAVCEDATIWRWDTTDF